MAKKKKDQRGELAPTYWIVPAAQGKGGEDAGWEYGLPPGIKPEEWPRHCRSGLPLRHGFTIRIPAEYRARGPELVALSYFHPGDSESYPSTGPAAARAKSILKGGKLKASEKGQAFWEALAAHAASKHPHSVIRRDILEHDHAIVWHTEEAFSGAKCRRPSEPLPDGINGKAMKLDAPVVRAKRLKMIRKAPDRVHIQLGWPLHPVQLDEDQLIEAGWSGMVMEIETDIGDVNYGDGNCQIDLQKGFLDWACT